MIKLFFLIIFFFAGPYSLRADGVPGGDQEFKKELDNIKDPFEDGIPKPVVVINGPTPTYHEEPKTKVLPMPEVLPMSKVLPTPKVLPMPEVFPMSKVLPRPEVLPMPKPQPEQEVVLPDLKLQGVMVGEDMHQAIINDQVVPLLGTIEGARVDSVSKEGVELSFKGKKFFLKVD